MAEAPVYAVARRFRKQLLEADANSLLKMAGAYKRLLDPVWPRMERLLDKVDDLIQQGQPIGPGLITRLWQEHELQQAYVRQLARFGSESAGRVTDEQRRMVELAFQHSRAMVDAALPPGIDTEVLAEAGLEWTQLHEGAVESLVGSFEQGAPLRELMAQAGAGTPGQVADALTEGLARGLSPRQVARKMKDAEGMGLTRALRVARTEQLRAYREATRATWQANPGIIKGYRRLAAKDGQTCFLAGTLVTTIAGDRAIEGIRRGEWVLTHTGLWRMVSEVMQRPYVGEFTAITLSSGESLEATSEHPVLLERQGELNWYPISCSTPGDRIIHHSKGFPQDVDHDFRDGTVERRIGQADHKVAVGNQAQRFAAISVRPSVPIDPVDFQGHIEIGEIEIDRIPINPCLLLIPNPQGRKALPRRTLGLGFSLVTAIADRAAEFLVAHCRDYAKALAAVLADIHHWRSSAFLRAIMPIGLGASGELLTATVTDHANRLRSPASEAAVDIACADRTLDLELLAAGDACLNEAGCGMLQIPATSGAETPTPSKRARWRTPVRFALGARDENRHTISISCVTKRHHQATVYNLEVEADHTYFANGILVHNCMACIALDGKLYPTNQPFPAHVADRCTMVPATVSYADLGLDVPEPKLEFQTAGDWFKKLPPAKQREMMGPGAFELWQAGKVKLGDFVATKTHPLWGKAELTASLKDMGKPKPPKAPRGPRAPKKPKGPAPVAYPDFKPQMTEDTRRAASKFLERGEKADSNSVARQAKADIEEQLTARMLKDPTATKAFREAWPNEINTLKLAGKTDAEFHAALLANPTHIGHLKNAMRGVVDEWAVTSADNSPQAVAMQELVQAEFPWVQAKAPLYRSPFARQREQLRSDVGTIVKARGPFYRRALRHMYENTQDALQAEGIEEVALVRGMNLAERPKWLEGGKRYDEVEVPLQPMSSFSSQIGTANTFMRSEGVVVGATVHRSWVLGTARTGFGCLNEYEYVVLAGPGKMQLNNIKGQWTQ